MRFQCHGKKQERRDLFALTTSNKEKGLYHHLKMMSFEINSMKK